MPKADEMGWTDPLPFYRAAQRRWTKAKGFRCPYIAMMVASLEGRGVHLDESEIRYLTGDDAIATIAQNHSDPLPEPPQ